MAFLTMPQFQHETPRVTIVGHLKVYLSMQEERMFFYITVYFIEL